jgi:hypothetical protein
MHLKAGHLEAGFGAPDPATLDLPRHVTMRGRDNHGPGLPVDFRGRLAAVNQKVGTVHDRHFRLSRPI